MADYLDLRRKHKVFYRRSVLETPVINTLEIYPKPDCVRVDFGGFVLFHHVRKSVTSP